MTIILIDIGINFAELLTWNIEAENYVVFEPKRMECITIIIRNSGKSFVTSLYVVLYMYDGFN